MNVAKKQNARTEKASIFTSPRMRRLVWLRLYRNRYIYLMILPVIVYFILLKYVPMWFLRLRAYTVERVTGTLKATARIAENLNFFCKTGGSAAGYAARRGGSVFRRSARGYRQVAVALDFFIKGERHPYLPAPAPGWDERHFPG